MHTQLLHCPLLDFVGLNLTYACLAYANVMLLKQQGSVTEMVIVEFNFRTECHLQFPTETARP